MFSIRSKKRLASVVFVALAMSAPLVGATPASALRTMPPQTGDVQPFTANGSISGTVLTSTGAAASMASVSLTDGNGNPQGGNPVSTDAQGLFTLPNVTPGNWFVAATPDPSSPEVMSNPSPAQVADGQAVNGITLNLQTATVTGHVYQPGNGTTPVMGSMVQLFGNNFQTTATTSSDGSYKAHADAGTYNVQANPPMGQNGFNNSAPAQVVVPTQPAAAVVQDFHLTTSTQNPGNGGGGMQGNVAGTVYEPGNSTTPVANAQVRVQSGFQQFGGGQADNSGHFTVYAAPGTYQLIATAPSGSAFAESTAVTIVVAQDGTVSSPNTIALHLMIANVNGHLYEPGSSTTPVANAYVQVNDQTGTFNATANTDSGGAYHLYIPTSPNAYTLQARPPFQSSLGASLRASLTVPANGNPTATPSFDLHLQVINVHGFLYEPGNGTTAVSNAPINIRSADFQYNDGTQTDNSGAFGLAVPAGTYTVSAGAPQGSSFSNASEVTVVVDSNGNMTSPQSLVLRLTTPNVSGHVYEPGNSTTGVSNANVSIHTADFSYFNNAQTSNDGSFAVNAAPGTYVLSANAPYGNTQFVMSADQTIHIDQSGHLTETSPLVVHLRMPNVSAQVLLPDANSAANANVQVRSADYRQFFNAQADNSGVFRFNLNPGSYVLTADPASGTPNAGRSADVTFTVANNGTTSGLGATVALRQPNVTGHVYQPGNSTPVPNTSISVRSTTDASFFTNAQADNSGAFAMTLAAGTYVLSAMPSQGSNYGNSVDQTITVSGVGSTVANLHLTTPNITGSVLAPSPSSTAIANANISITAVDQPLYYGTQSDNSGNFRLTVPNGTYNVTVEPPSGGTYSRSLTTQLVVDANHLSSVLTLRVTTPNVTGTVSDTGGTPASGASVMLQNNATNFFANTQTDNNGQFNLYAPAGTYVLTAQPPSSSTQAASDPQTVVIANNGSGGTGKQLSFSSSNVTGVLLPPSPSNAGVANAYVTIHTSDWATQFGAQTDQNGGFRFHVAEGDYIISGQPPYGNASYGRSFDVPVHVSAQGTSQVSVRLTSPNVSGTVYLPNGTTVPNVNVSVRDANNTFFTNAQTDAQGIFRLSVPANGTYIATADAPNGTSLSGSAPVNVTVNANGVLTAPLPLALTLTNPSIVGQVFDPGANAGSTNDDVASGGGYVNVHNNDFTIQLGAQVRNDGRFSIGGLPAGTYTAEVAPGWGSQGLLRTTISVVVPANQSSWPVTLESSPGSGRVYLGVASQTISVAVKRNDNSRITSGATVQAFDQNGQFTEVSTVDGSNNYVLHVTPGTWNVSVMSKNTANDWIYSGRPTTIATTACTVDPCVSLGVSQAAGHVTGTIVYNGSPIGANTAYIDVRTPNGNGNGIPVGANGQFDVRVPPGTYQVSVHPQDETKSGPAPVSVTIAGSETKSVGNVTLVGRTARVQGSVTYANTAQGGNTATPVVAAHVYAFQPGGGEFVDGITQTDGTYSLNLTPGEWHVGIFAQAADSWIYNNPPQVVTVGANQTVTSTNFTVSASAATLRGQVLDPNGAVASVDGFVQATSTSGAGGGAPLQNGTFSIPLAAGTFSLQLFVAPNSPYSPPAAQQVTVASNGTVSPVTIQLLSNDKEVTGQIVGSNGSSLTNVDVIVSATKGSSYTETHSDANGVYHLPLADGTWSISARIATSGYNLLEIRRSNGTPATGTITLDNAHTTVTRNVAVVPSSRTLTGSVRDSNGGAVQGAFVNIDSAPNAATVVHTGINTDAAGAFSVAVPDGVYVVGASGGSPGDLAPSALTVSINANGQTPASAVLNFRHPASTISGTVTSGGAPTRATVQAWSQSGGFVSTVSDSNTGAYSLSVTDNDTWNVSVSAPNTTNAASTLVAAQQSVRLSAGGSSSGVNFALAPVVVPSGLTTTFDAASGRTITLGGDTPSPTDDVTIVVPAGALATTGNVSITATPIALPNETSTTHPLGIGYSFEAFDSTGQRIRNAFNRPLTITFGYDQVALDASGVTAESLIPSYWDPATQTYRRTDTAVADTDTHKITFTTDHFTSWVVAASATAPTAPRSVTATANGGGAATVNWLASGSDGGSAITGYTVTSSGGQTMSAASTDSSVVFSGLTSGATYTFTVHATNGVGNSVESASSGPLVIDSGGTSQPGGAGYLLIGSNGAVYNHGGAAVHGSPVAQQLNSPIVGSASTISGNGYWLVASDGGIFSYGDAQFYGSAGATHLNKPIVGMSATPTGHGYWLVASDGGIFSYGDAQFYGSAGAMKLNKPIVGMKSTATGNGYWLVASDGGIFSYGDAQFYGSAGATHLNKPIVGMSATPTGHGYWLVASDGGIFSYGDAQFYGSAGATKLNKPIVGMKSTATGNGYWLVASDGGIFNYGDATFAGSEGGSALQAPVVAIS